MMSLDAVQKFYQELENDPVLRQRALALQHQFENQEQLIESFIELGAERGHSFTATELVQFIFIHGTPDN